MSQTPPPIGGPPGEGFRPACKADQVPENSAMQVSIEGLQVAVVHAAGQFFAVHDQCTHAEVPLSEGEVETDGTQVLLECWMHGSCFDVRTGQPTNLPATEPVATYPTAVVGGQVYVNVTTE